MGFLGSSLLTLLMLVSSGSKTPEELAKRIFSAIEANDFGAIQQLMVDPADIALTLDHFEMDANRREKVKRSLVEKMEQDMPLTVSTIEKGFKDVQAVLSSKKCKKCIVDMGLVNSITSQEIGLPFEIGDLDIEILCYKQVEKISVEKMTVEIIHTESGWYILEKLRLLPQ
jgi:hypothetical protein